MGLRATPQPSWLSADEHLAGVGASQEVPETVDSIVDSIDNRFAPDDLALGQPLTDLCLERRTKVLVVEDDESAQGQTFADDHRHVARAGCRLGRVVDRDHPADGDTTTGAKRRDGGLEMVAPDVVEVDVDALGCSIGQALADRCRLVVDGRVETGLIQKPGGLVGAARAADDERSALEAGGPDKTAWLRDEAGFNAAIDY